MAFLCPVRIKRTKKKKPLDDDSMPGLGGNSRPGGGGESRGNGSSGGGGHQGSLQGGSGGGPAPSMGRITGSASIETLVRVGIEKENGLSPESKMVVLHDFTPCVDDELEVKRGQIVHVLYQENDWVYVISEDASMGTGGKNNNGGNEGFIPHSYCAQFGSQLAELALNVKKKLPRAQTDSQTGIPTEAGESGPPTDPAGMSVPRGSSVGPPAPNAAAELPLNSRSNSIMSSETSSQPDSHPFFKESTGKYIVLYNYSAQDENDLSVERGQCVTVLNTEDGDWFWVAKHDGAEGFVPAGFIYPLDAIQRQQGLSNNALPGNRSLLQPMGGGGGTQLSNRGAGPLSNSSSVKHPVSFPPGPSSLTPNSSMPSTSYQNPSSNIIMGPQSHRQQQGPTSSMGPPPLPLQSYQQPSWLASSTGSSGPPSFSNPGLPQQQLQLGGVNQPPSIPPAGSGGYVSNGGLAGDLHFPHHHGGGPGGGGSLPMQQTSVPTPPQPSSSNNSAHPPAPSVGSLASSFNNMTMQVPSSVGSPHKSGLLVGSPLLSATSSSGAGGATVTGMTMARATPCSNPSPALPRHQQQSSSSGGIGGPAHTSGLPTTPASMQPRPPQPSAGSASNFNPEVNSDVPPPAPANYNGTELVMLYDYKAQAPDDLTVKRGDWIYADLNNQTVDGWLWCYAPKTRKYGFIPKAYARPPAMTSL